MATSQIAAPNTNGGKPSAIAAFLRLPLYITFLLILFGGVFLLHRQAAQARDTARKHHLQDLEDALYFSRAVHGTFPPYDQPSWCGFITPGSDSAARQQLEAALRQQNSMYAKAEKPFPADPLQINQRPFSQPSLNYFYWKRSPAVFELFAQLEADPHQLRLLNDCPGISPLAYNYSLTSLWRENR